MSGPDPADVADLTRLLDLMRDFENNEQRARYLLSSDWMRDRGAAAAERNALILQEISRRYMRGEQRTLPADVGTVPASQP